MRSSRYLWILWPVAGAQRLDLPPATGGGFAQFPGEDEEAMTRGSEYQLTVENPWFCSETKDNYYGMTLTLKKSTGSETEVVANLNNQGKPEVDGANGKLSVPFPAVPTDGIWIHIDFADGSFARNHGNRVAGYFSTGADGKVSQLGPYLVATFAEIPEDDNLSFHFIGKKALPKAIGIRASNVPGVVRLNVSPMPPISTKCDVQDPFLQQVLKNVDKYPGLDVGENTITYVLIGACGGTLLLIIIIAVVCIVRHRRRKRAAGFARPNTADWRYDDFDPHLEAKHWHYQKSAYQADDRASMRSRMEGDKFNVSEPLDVRGGPRDAAKSRRPSGDEFSDFGSRR